MSKLKFPSIVSVARAGSYDQDHRGFWGCSSPDGTRVNSNEIAKDLLEQAREEHACWLAETSAPAPAPSTPSTPAPSTPSTPAPSTPSTPAPSTPSTPAPSAPAVAAPVCTERHYAPPSGYNGWSNYETWAVNLWLDNEQSTQEYWLETACEVLKAADDLDGAKYDLAQTLKSEVSESMPELGASMWADLLGAALGEVDWQEIAAAFLEAAKEQIEE